MIQITAGKTSFEREALKAPFGFKGKYINELWQTAAFIESQSGNSGIGLGVQSILWSDSGVFEKFSEAAANSIMFLLTEYALQTARHLTFDTPIDLLEQLLPKVYEYARTVTGLPALRKTFVLNALVAADNAAWILYCREKGIAYFDDMIPEGARTALSFKQSKLAGIPLVTYGMSLEQIRETVNDGYFFLKIKIGSDPDKDGSQEKMLEWDKKRLASIHNMVKDCKTPYTTSGKIPYYLDANGRYSSKDFLYRFLEHADRIGALEHILLLEEPFPEELVLDVSDVPVRLAADESAHSAADALERIQMGYRAIALKPIAKTLSMSFKIAEIACKMQVPCFCADLTVNPVMVDWNKNVAARLAPLPGMKIGIIESNGHQNYSNWDLLQSYHPCSGALWTKSEDGLFILDNDFYESSGGIFEIGSHYSNLFNH